VLNGRKIKVIKDLLQWFVMFKIVKCANKFRYKISKFKFSKI